MIKKIIILANVFLMLSIHNVHADLSSTGTIQRVDLEARIVEINNIEYQIETNKTALISGQHILDLNMLEKGNLVNFKLKGNLLIEIILITPFEFQS